MPPVTTQRGQREKRREERKGAEEKALKSTSILNKQKTPHPTIPHLQRCARREGHPGAPPGGLHCLLLCLLEFVIVYVVRVVLASLATGATRGLLHSIPLYGAEHSLQYGMRFSVIKD